MDEVVLCSEKGNSCKKGNPEFCMLSTEEHQDVTYGLVRQKSAMANSAHCHQNMRSGYSQQVPQSVQIISKTNH